MLGAGQFPRWLSLQIILSRLMWYDRIFPQVSMIKSLSHPVVQELQRILSRSLDVLYAGSDTNSGLQVNIDFLLVIKTFETQVFTWRQVWVNHRDYSGKSLAMHV